MPPRLSVAAADDQTSEEGTLIDEGAPVRRRPA